MKDKDKQKTVRIATLIALVILADRIGVSKEYLSQIENGQKSGTVDIFRRLSNVFDVELDDLTE